MSIEISKIIHEIWRKYSYFVYSETIIISFMTFSFLELLIQLPSNRSENIDILHLHIYKRPEKKLKFIFIYSYQLSSNKYRYYNCDFIMGNDSEY